MSHQSLSGVRSLLEPVATRFQGKKTWYDQLSLMQGRWYMTHAKGQCNTAMHDMLLLSNSS